MLALTRRSRDLVPRLALCFVATTNTPVQVRACNYCRSTTTPEMHTTTGCTRASTVQGTWQGTGTERCYERPWTTSSANRQSHPRTSPNAASTTCRAGWGTTLTPGGAQGRHAGERNSRKCPRYRIFLERKHGGTDRAQSAAPMWRAPPRSSSYDRIPFREPKVPRQWSRTYVRTYDTHHPPASYQPPRSNFAPRALSFVLQLLGFRPLSAVCAHGQGGCRGTCAH